MDSFISPPSGAGGAPAAPDMSETPEYEPRKIFVGGLSWNTDEVSMKDYFEKFGAVSDCIVMREPDQPEGLKKNRGFGFVTFEEQSGVEKVVNTTGHMLDDKTIDPKRAQKKSGVKDTDKKVFIGGLSATTTEKDVEDYFNACFGGVTEVVFKVDNSTQRKRGFGFVVFESADFVSKVLQTQYHDIDGKKVEVKQAQPRSVTASAMRQTNSGHGIGIYPPYGGQEYQGGNGHPYGHWGGGSHQYPYPPQPHPGYAHQQYSGGAGNYYDPSSYPRTQSSSGERTDQQQYYQTPPSYGQQQGVAGAYGHDSGYGHSGRGGYGGTHGGYGQQSGGYGRGGHQQQRYGGHYNQ